MLQVLNTVGIGYRGGSACNGKTCRCGTAIDIYRKRNAVQVDLRTGTPGMTFTQRITLEYHMRKREQGQVSRDIGLVMPRGRQQSGTVAGGTHREHINIERTSQD